MPNANIRVDDRCRWCGQLHPGEACPLVDEIEYNPDGSVKRVKFKTGQQKPKARFED